MAVRFSLNLKNLFKSTPKSDLPDNGFELPGQNGEAIILIHGMTGTPHEMRFLANYLNRQGYAVYCPRLANHGAPIHILQMSKWQDFYQTVRQSYLQIRGQYKHIYTGGLSMGALLALLLADEFKNEIAGVSCLSPTLFYDGWNSPWYRFFLPLAYKTPLKYFFYFKEEPPYGIKNEAVRRRIHEFYNNADLDNLESVQQYGYPFFPLTLLYQLEKLVKHLSGRLQDISIPVQLIQAQHDDMSSVRNSEFIYNRVKSNRKELVLLHNSYHIITADQERNTVAMHMQRFFSPDNLMPSNMPLINRLSQLESKLQVKSPIVLSNCRVFFDFDNTMTTTDVLFDVIERFSINDHWMALEKAWLDGQIGTKECLEGQLRNVRISKTALYRFLKKAELDPHFHKLLALFVQEGIKPVILSDNFTCIVEWILEHHAIKDLKVYGNALRFYRDHIIPSFPYDNPFCLSCAHCKKIHLTKDKTENKLIVYIGDGRSDYCPARVSDIVFAKDNLLRFMAKEELPYIAYKDLGDVYRYFQELLNHG